MIHNIKVFNPQGELLKVINGQKIMDRRYAILAESIGRTVWGKSAKKFKTNIVCSVCKKKAEGRANQFTCGSHICLKEHRERIRLKKYPNPTRTFKCVTCGIKVETRHHNKKTCGLEKCFTLTKSI